MLAGAGVVSFRSGSRGTGLRESGVAHVAGTPSSTGWAPRRRRNAWGPGPAGGGGAGTDDERLVVVCARCVHQLTPASTWRGRYAQGTWWLPEVLAHEASGSTEVLLAHVGRLVRYRLHDRGAATACHRVAGRSRPARAGRPLTGHVAARTARLPGLMRGSSRQLGAGLAVGVLEPALILPWRSSPRSSMESAPGRPS